MLNHKNVIVSLMLVMSISLGFSGITHAADVSSISQQEQIQTVNLSNQLRVILGKDPSRTGIFIEKVTLLQGKTKNPKIQRMLTALLNVAREYVPKQDTPSKVVDNKSVIVPSSSITTNKVPQQTTVTRAETSTTPESIVQPTTTTSGIPGREVGFEELKTVVGKYVEVDNTLQFTENGKKKRLIPKNAYKISTSDKTRIFSNLDYKSNAIYKINGAYYYANQYSIEDISTGTVVVATTPNTNNSVGVTNTTTTTPNVSVKVYTFDDLKKRVKGFFEVKADTFETEFNGKKSIFYPNGYMEFSPERDSNWIYQSSTLMDRQNFDFGNQAIYKTMDMNGKITFYLTRNGFLTEDITTIDLTAKNLIVGLNSDEQKISAIYRWITSNIKYDDIAQNEVLHPTGNDKLIADAVYPMRVFDRKMGICSGYSKLLVLMLGMAGVQGASVEADNVYLVPDFNKPLGHAWVKVNNDFYDATWDNGKANYSYFKIPQDVMYARNLANFISNSADERKKEYAMKLFELAKKYKGQGYSLLKNAEILNDLGISINNPLTKEQLAMKLKAKVSIYLDSLENGIWTFMQNGIKKQFKQRKGIALLDFSTFISQSIENISQEALIYDKNTGDYFLTIGGYDITTVSP